MRGPRARARAGCRALAALLCVPLAAVLVATTAPAQRLAPTLVPAAVPAVVPAVVPPAQPPRIAFTDAADATAVAPEAVVPEPDAPEPLAPDPPAAGLAAGVTTHVGEASVSEAGLSASISTAADPSGEVYLTDVTAEDPTPGRVTCDNTAVESHPVVSPDGTRVAYASNASGVFRLWLGVIEDDEVPSCATTTHVQLAGAPGGENLWPGWVSDDRLVFSGTGLDPLGDIWIVDVGSASEPVFDAPATRLTDHPAAETQPSHGFVPRFDTELSPELSVVVLTTTQFRPDGSLGYVVLPQPDASPGPTPTGPPVIFSVGSLWGDEEPRQGTEGVWSPSGNEIAYTTTELDPYGDVVRADVEDTDVSSVVLVRDSVAAIAAAPGRAESHPAWLPPPGEGQDQQWSYTLRTATGDVSDVVATDGTGRRTIAGDVGDGPLDESTPTYSPDGSRVAYSRTTPSGTGREVVMADSDGGDVVVLDSDRPDDAIDVEPAWSPDGTRIAFVRFPPCECLFRTSEIWVADVNARTAQRVTTVPEETAYWDENPSWSPDGTRLVIARTVEHLQPDLVVSLTGPETVGAGDAVEFTARVDNLGRGTANGVRLTLSAPEPNEEFPADITLEPVDPACTDATGNRLTCVVDPLGADEGSSLAFRVRGAFEGAFAVSASVVVTGAPDEPETTNNTASRVIAVTTPPDVVVTAAPTSFTNLSEESVTITFTVSNTGSLPASPVTLEVTSAGVPSPPGAVTVTPADTETRCGDDEVAPFTCQLGTINRGAPTQVVVVVSPVSAFAVEVRGVADRVPAEVDGDDNVALVRGSVCCAPPRINAAIPSALLAGAPAAGAARAQVNRPTVVREVPEAPPDGPATTLWVIDAETGAGHELAGPGPRTCVCPEVVPGRGPAWSPDGLRVAYENRGSVLVLHLADPRGDAVALDATQHPRIDVVTGFSTWTDTAATPTPSRSAISVAEDPAWSPDGKQLAIAAQPAGHPDQRGIYRIAPDGTGLTVVAQGRGPETEPAWQPFADLAVTLTAVPDRILIGTTSTLTATVTNTGPTRASDVSLELTVPAGLSVSSVPATCTVLAPGLVSCDLGTLASGTSAVVTVPVTGTVVGTHAVRADVGSPVPDPVATNNSATATVEVTREPPVTDVSVTVRMDPDPGYVGGTGTLRVEISNSAGGTLTGVTVTISHPAAIVTLTGTPTCFTGSACSIGSLAPDGRRTLTAPVTFRAAGSGALTASVTSTVRDTAAANDRATRLLAVKKPAVRILQPIGTPGSVAMAVGEQFPPGSRVLLSWDEGLNPRETAVVVAADGTVPPTQVLVFRRDRIGPRLLLATPQDPTQYTAVSTPMLVTPRTVTPPADFVSRN